MIAAAGIEDQELAVIAEHPRINHPAVARGGDLRARTGRDRKALFGASEPVRSAKFLDSHAIDRERQPALGGHEGDGRRQAARLAPQSRARTTGFVLARAAREAETLLELGDQVLEDVGLVRELSGELPLTRAHLL